MEPFTPEDAQEEEDHPDVGIEAKGHNLYTHFPFDKNCPVCQNCKMQKVQHRQTKNKSVEHDGTEFPKSLCILRQITPSWDKGKTDGKANGSH